MILLECTVTLRDGDRKKLQAQIAAEIGQPVVLLPNGVSRAKERNILFLCDRKACEKCSYPTCRHTPELEHARNFAPAGFTKRTDGVWVEQEGVTIERKIDQDKLEKRLVEAMREATGLEGEKTKSAWAGAGMISSVSTDAHTAADRRNRASNSGKKAV